MVYPMDTRFTHFPDTLLARFNRGLRILTCNVRNGGNKHKTPKLVDMLLNQSPHTLVLTEFRLNDVGRQTIRKLKRENYHLAYTDVKFGVLIASRDEFQSEHNPLRSATNDGKILEATFDSWKLHGIYFPQGEAKEPHFEHLLACATKESIKPSVAIGDFNTGRNSLDIQPFRYGIKSGTPFTSEKQFLNLETLWTEAWRAKHPEGDQYSWYIKRRNFDGYNGYRIDHCFLSQTLLKRLEHAAYLHQTRHQGLTDHSALIVDITF